MIGTITQDMIAKGLVITTPGQYFLGSNLFVAIPSAPTTQNWNAFANDRPCAISIRANDVVLDLQALLLAASTEHSQGLVLVHVAANVQNVVVQNGQLMTCSIGLLLDERCTNSLVQGLVVSNFLEKGIVAYSPQGLTIASCSIGPNLTSFYTISQELYELVLYGALISAADLQAWNCFSDNLLLAETSHVAGIAIVPDAAHDAPYPVKLDTSSDVVLVDVNVEQLTMNYREHSLLLGLSRITGAATKARGVLGEVLPEWYLLRRAASRRVQLGFYPSLQEPARPFITDAGGFSINTGEEPADAQVTAWVRGVDREGNAMRGVQAILIVGAGVPVLTNVTAATPIIKTLLPRVLLPAPKGVEQSDLTVTTRASGTLVLPAPAIPKIGCCSKVGAAAAFSSTRIRFNVQPQGNVNPMLTGSISGVNAAVNFL